MAKTIAKIAARTASVLLLFVVIFTALLAGTYQATKEDIQKSADEEKMKLINEVLPKSAYDNDLLKDTRQLASTPELGQDNSLAYRARRSGQPVAVILEAIAPDGYSGKIRLVVAITYKGEVAGVRVVEHRETPGLGDYIEPRKDKNKERPWITQFNGLSFGALPEKDWKVKKDGGRFDYVSGATVTPRAVVKAVTKAVKYVEANRETLFAAGETQ